MAVGTRRAEGRPMGPQAKAEHRVIDVAGLVEHIGRQGEIARLRAERKNVIEWLTDYFAGVDDLLAERGASLEVRRAVSQTRDELIRFHEVHYEWSEGKTEEVCRFAEAAIREVNRYGEWWQGRKA